ncbi:hypothetical protein CYMTET_43478 [Cymbomonas tetramitiformis]|uniref:Uncharacterized protein n=1 Tax=Cymbomonas tetramitiformis TaxID=36881 RepID=A0AAE0C3D3_9CHLO|nr:hypothetical protein CYMTET_43478 [Cymbomonas tetramitiformis]
MGGTSVIRGDSGSAQHVAKCNGHSVVYAGSVPADEFPGCLEAVEFQKCQAQQHVTGGKRSAANNKQGHQKTPSFILALVRDARNAVAGDAPATKSAPLGGFTDVGLHTGGIARSTVWSLVRFTLLV